MGEISRKQQEDANSFLITGQASALEELAVLIIDPIIFGEEAVSRQEPGK